MVYKLYILEDRMECVEEIWTERYYSRYTAGWNKKYGYREHISSRDGLSIAVYDINEEIFNIIRKYAEENGNKEHNELCEELIEIENLLLSTRAISKEEQRKLLKEKYGIIA